VSTDGLGSLAPGHLFGGAVEEGDHPVRVDRQHTVVNAVEKKADMLGKGLTH
jgi:hypothetical protein